MTKLELKSSHEVIYTVDVADIESIFYCKPTDPDILTVLMKDGKRLYCDEVCPIDSLQELVSEDLEEASRNYADNEEYGDDVYFAIKAAFKAGGQWQKEHLWKPADGDDLPEIDREVIVLCKNGRIAFGHRPFEKFMARPIGYGRTEEYEVKTYDKGGWNQPDVKWWLDIELSKRK